MFTYPFRYVPAPQIVEASRELISRILGDPALDAVFRDGKMMGVLQTDRGYLYDSPEAGRRSTVSSRRYSISQTPQATSARVKPRFQQ